MNDVIHYSEVAGMSLAFRNMIAAVIKGQVAIAVEQERERCAKVVEQTTRVLSENGRYHVPLSQTMALSKAAKHIRDGVEPE